jgi:5-formyltetrahydrofolate cyclo-ligase
MQQAPTRVMQRRALIAARDALSSDQRAHFSSAMRDHLRLAMMAALGPLDRLKVGAYYPLGSEPSLIPLFSEFLEVALPSVTARDAELTFLRYWPGAKLVHEGLGVQVPEQREVTTPSILLIPCVGFKRRKDGRIDRLGYGGGFYDRTLAKQRRLTIGIAFEQGELADFEALPHDRPLDALVTEQGLTGQLDSAYL